MKAHPIDAHVVVPRSRSLPRSNNMVTLKEYRLFSGALVFRIHSLLLHVFYLSKNIFQFFNLIHSIVCKRFDVLLKYYWKVHKPANTTKTKNKKKKKHIVSLILERTTLFSDNITTNKNYLQ